MCHLGIVLSLISFITFCNRSSQTVAAKWLERVDRQLDTLGVASCVRVLSGPSPSALTARDCPKMKWAFNSFRWCCKPASTTCGPSTRMKSSKAQFE
uniref:Putative secreted protein n=1 Tax=Ixodes ricinus TaxID=34613 RepID=A0A6B0UDI9_IXORI